MCLGFIENAYYTKPDRKTKRDGKRLVPIFITTLVDNNVSLKLKVIRARRRIYKTNFRANSQYGCRLNHALHSSKHARSSTSNEETLFELMKLFEKVVQRVIKNIPNNYLHI